MFSVKEAACGCISAALIICLIPIATIVIATSSRAADGAITATSGSAAAAGTITPVVTTPGATDVPGAVATLVPTLGTSGTVFVTGTVAPRTTGTLTVISVTAVTGQGSAVAAQNSFDAGNMFMNMLLDPFNDSRHDEGGAISFAKSALGYATKKPDGTDAFAAIDRRAPAFAGRWKVWGSGYGGNNTLNGNAAAGTSTVASRVFGTTVGADYRLTSNTSVGFATGGATTNFNAEDGRGSGRADLFQAGVFARHMMGAAYVSAALAYSWQNVSTDRTVTMSGTDLLHASFNTNTFGARGETGYRFATAFIGFTPYAAAQSTTFVLPSYSESVTSGSNTFAMAYSSKTTTNVRSELGVRADRSFLVSDGIVTLRTRAAWAHDSNTDRPVTAAFQALPGATFTVNGAQPSPNAALLTAGAEMKWHNGWSLAGTLDGEFSNTTRSYAGKGSVKYGW